MKTLRHCILLGLVAAAGLFSIPARAQYTYFNSQGGSDVLVQEVRWPYWNSSFYDTWLSQWWQSSDGVSGYFYSGLPNPPAGSPSPVKQGVNWSFWPLSNPININDTITPVYVMPTCTFRPTIGEGTICVAPTSFSFWVTNVWYREAFRTWQPVDGTPHRGYAGQWLRDGTTGVWYHYGTMQLPFAVTGIGGQMTFQEHFTGGANTNRMEHRNVYYYKGGTWNSANQFTCNTACSVGLMENNSVVYCEAGTTNGYVANTWITLTQPATPNFLDPILVTNYGATVSGSQMLVQWQIPNTSSPQFAYRIDIYTNASHTGTVGATFYDIDPEARQKLVNIPGIATPYPQLTIVDVFYQTNQPVTVTVSNANLSAATSVPGATSGLNFAYYETATNWSALPNFASLTPVLRGAVSSLDLTPRRQRFSYGFNYTGYLNAPSNGLYAFTLNSDQGSQLYVDGQLVVNNDGLHSPEDLSGEIGLQAGYHVFSVQFFCAAQDYYDTLGLSWEGPGLPKTAVPVTAFYRLPGVSEPVVSVTSPTNTSTVNGASVPFSATVTANGNTISNVQFYVGNSFWGQDTVPPYNLNSFVWANPSNAIRARLYYNGTNLIDSPVNSVTTTNMALSPWQFGQIFYHNYPSGASIQGNTYSVIGDGVNLLTRQANGDCILTAHLAGLPGTAALPDGSTTDTGWQAGIILRGTTNMTPGYPWGQSGGAPFTAVFGNVSGGAYYQDEEMVNGGGGYSSGNLGGQKWYRIQRTGNLFTSSASSDGNSWTVVNTNTLTDFGPTLYAGFFTYAGPSYNPNVHWASFDNVNLTGTNILGPASVSITPQTNAVIGGLPATFWSSVIGPAPTAYQWQLNGTNILNATNSSYSIAGVATTDVGNYAVVANSVTSALAVLLITAPAGSGVWTNLNGGSWVTSNNWSGGLVAGGVDAAADFSTLGLSLNPTVTLDGARTNGTLVFDDLNPNAKHNWTLGTGSGGPLTLAVSSGTPSIAVKSATNIISAVAAGTQGFNKTGAGYLTLSGASTITGTINVNAGTLEVQGKSGDTPYTVAAGATLKVGYGTGGGYANTGLKVTGNGAAATTGFYLAGGASYNASGQITLQLAPTTIRQYGSGLAAIGTFDINGNGLWCNAAASGSSLDPNIQIVSRGYGMSVQVDAGANTATGDLTINGPLNVGSLGFYKRGSGSLVLNGVATSGNTALQLQGGTVFCGTTNCIGANASVPISSSASLQLNGFNQTIASLNAAPGSTVSFGGTNTLTVGNPPALAGALQMSIAKSAAPASSKLITTGTLTNGGSLTVNNLGPNALGAGDSFALLSASSYAGAFTSVTLPVLPVGLLWDTSNLYTNGTVAVTTNTGLSRWTGGGTNADWSTSENWGGTLPIDQQFLTFQGTLRQNNTNDLLATAGQVFFTNGGFVLTGNPVTLLWGLVNQAGSNTWGLGTTMAAAQSFISSNGTLNITGAVTNNGYTLTLDGAGTNLLAGPLSGPGDFLKTGLGMATLLASNSYAGTTLVAAGTLRLGTNTAIGANAFVTNGATLDLNGQKLAINEPFTVSGAGVGGVTAITNSTGTEAYLKNLTLAGDTTFNNGNTICIGSTTGQDGNLNLNGYTLTKNGSGKIYLNGLSMSGPGNIAINGGTVCLINDYSVGGQQNTTMAGTGTITVNAGATLSTAKWGTSLTVTMPIVLNGGSIASEWPGPNGGTFASPVLVNSNSTINFNTGYGSGTLSGDISGTGGLTVTGDGSARTFTGNNSYGWTTISAGTLRIGNGGTSGTLGLGNVTNNATLAFNRADALSVTNRISGTGALTQGGAGTLALYGTNNYTGATTISAGALLVNGSIGTNTFTVQTNATLGGTGTINGATTVQNGGMLAPGTNSIGKLTFGSSLVLAGSTAMEVSRNGGVPTNDLVFVSGTLTQGGALIVTNTGTNALTAGNSFKLFTAGTYAGSFTNLSLPALAGGLTWKTNTLASNGTIAVSNLLYTLTYTAGTNGTLGGSPTQTVAYGLSGTAVTAQPNPNYHFASWSDGLTANPRTETNVTNNLNVTANFVRLVTPVVTNLNLAVNRTSFTLAGTGGAGQNYVLLTATNLPPAAWTPVLTNTADTNGVFQLTDSQITNCPQRFYRVQAGQ